MQVGDLVRIRGERRAKARVGIITEKDWGTMHKLWKVRLFNGSTITTQKSGLEVLSESR